MDKDIYALKDTGIAWFENIEEGLESKGIFQSQVYPSVCSREKIVSLFYVYYCLMFIPYQDKIDSFYTSL